MLSSWKCPHFPKISTFAKKVDIFSQNVPPFNFQSKTNLFLKSFNFVQKKSFLLQTLCKPNSAPNFLKFPKIISTLCDTLPSMPIFSWKVFTSHKCPPFPRKNPKICSKFTIISTQSYSPQTLQYPHVTIKLQTAPKNVLIFYNCLHVPPTVFWLCYLLFKSLSKRTENVLNLSWNVHIFLKDTDSFPRSNQTFLKYPQFAKKSPSYQNVQSFPKSPLSENIWTIFLKLFIFYHFSIFSSTIHTSQ